MATRCWTPGSKDDVTRWILASRLEPDLMTALKVMMSIQGLRSVGVVVEEDYGPRSKALKAVLAMTFPKK